MKVVYDGKNYSVRFSYDMDEDGRYVTDCEIRRILDKGFEIIAYDFVTCSKSDQFNKAVGRKLALTRALDFSPREFKKVVWEAYWNSGARRK